MTNDRKKKAVLKLVNTALVYALLAMAGANYYMGVPVGDDVMLSYQDTSFHDDATLRELTHRLPAPEFHRWMMKMDLMDENGILTARAGDGSIFLK